MAVTVSADVYQGLPGAIRVSVVGAGGSLLLRLDPRSTEPHPVRNFDGSQALEVVVDCEAPLGRSVQYQVVDALGAVLGTSEWVAAPALTDNRGLLRSPLRPSVSWLVVEPQDETGVEWETSTTVHRIVGSDTPVVVGEVRQRHTGTMTFLCRSIAEADQLVRMCGDGTVLLLRHDPCASDQTRDMLFYPLSITEKRYGRVGWRLVSVDYQTTKWVPGETEEPPLGLWTFGDLRDSAATFGELAGRYESFGAMALNAPRSIPLGGESD